jgi:WS/DGAT/MGAT family acyltransferase
MKLADRLFLTADSNETPQHVAALGIFSPPEGAPDDFVGQLAERFRAIRTFAAPFNYRLTHPRLKSVAPGWLELADDGVDLDYHFRHNALPRPGGQRELGQLVSRLHSRALDPNRPLWDIHLIDGLDDGRFALYFKVHHALMDGVGGIRRLRRMLSTDPDDATVRALWTIGPSRRPGQAEDGGSPA